MFDSFRFDVNSFDVVEKDENLIEVELVVSTKTHLVKTEHAIVNTVNNLICTINRHWGIIQHTKKQDVSRIETIEKVNKLLRNKDNELTEIIIDGALGFINSYTHRDYSYKTLPTSLLPILAKIIEKNTGSDLVGGKKLGDYSVTYRGLFEVDESIRRSLDIYRRRIFVI